MTVPGVRGTLIARNALLNLTALVIPLVIALVALPIMIHGLGTERFGVLAIVWMVLTYVAELGFGPTTQRYAAEALGGGRSHELGAIIWTTARLQVAVGAAEGLALAAITPWLVTSVLNIPPAMTSEARNCFFVLAAAIPLLGLAKSFRGLVEAAQRFDLALAVHLPLTAGSYVVAAVGAARGWSLLAVFGVILIARLISVPANFMMARRALPDISFKPTAHGAGLRELVTFAGWVSLSGLLSPLLVYIDRFIVGALLTMSAVTFYAAPYELVARLVLIPGSILGALYPAFSQLAGQRDREQAEQLAARSVNLMVVLLGPVIILARAGARDGLPLWLGPEYAVQSAAALQILAVGVLVNAAAHVPFGLLQSIARPDVPARFHLIELPIHIIVAWVLISRFGITGAAAAWTGRTMLDAGLLFAAASRMKVLRAPALSEANLPTTLAILTAAGAAAILAAAFIVSPGARITLAAAVVGVTAALLWFVAVPVGERLRITTFLRPGA